MDEKLKKQQEAEAQKKIDDAVATAKKDLEDQIKKKDEEIFGLKNKDQNFSEIRKKLEDAEKEKGELKTKLEITEKEVVVGKTKEQINKSIDSVAGKDENLKKLIEYHFEKIGADAKTPEEIEAKVKEALELSKVDRRQGVIRKQEAAAGGKKIDAAGDFSVDPELRKWADEFERRTGTKISNEDIIKYSKNKK